MKTFLIQFAILIALFLFFILAIELHHWYKFTIKLPPNDNQTITWGHKVKNNKMGFREKDFDLLTLCQPNRFVILILGDSLTWGVGLDDKQRYSNLLEEFLQQEYQNKQITVLNFATQGASTIKERDIFRLVYKEIKPDLLIVGFCKNDPQEKQDNYSKERDFYFLKIMPVLTFLSNHKMFSSLQLLSQIYENILISFKKIPNWYVALDRVYDEQSAEWHGFTKALKDIAEMTKEIHSNPPIFISLNAGASTSNRVPTDYNNPDKFLNFFLKWYHQAENAAKQAGFITVNCEEEFKKLKNYIMAVIPGVDGHPDAEMNKIYAKKLFSIIKAYKFIER